MSYSSAETAVTRILHRVAGRGLLTFNTILNNLYRFSHIGAFSEMGHIDLNNLDEVYGGAFKHRKGFTHRRDSSATKSIGSL